MSKVRITKDVTIVPNQTSTVLYRKGQEITAPNDHIDQIVKAGAGERIGDDQRSDDQKVAENEDAFKSGSDNVSIG